MQTIAHHLPLYATASAAQVQELRSLVCSKHPEWFIGGAQNLFGELMNSDPLINFFSQMKELIDPVSHNLFSAQLLSFMAFYGHKPRVYKGFLL